MFSEIVDWIKFFMNITTFLAPWLFLCMLFPHGIGLISSIYFGIAVLVLFPTVGYFVLIVFMIIPFCFNLLVALGGG